MLMYSGSILPGSRFGCRKAPATTASSRPNCTPPYTPCFPLRMPSLASRIRPSSTSTCEEHRSFHSCGISARLPFAEVPTTLNQDSSSAALVSSRNLASTDALANSRKLKMALLRSAMRSKCFVKVSAYFTSGWSGLVMGLSTKPRSPSSCSRACTPMVTRGMSTLSSDRRTSALFTTNHSRAFHAFSLLSSSEKSKQLFIPTTGWSYSPMESSFKW
mmetsp:Transcript_115238/g.336914  ORF Transcript_115238/g.336914 Transcript_115238/m.336914 type:complete len:217 (+) Transcript_115238:1621-2271(+)